MIQAESKKSKSLLIIDDNEDICIAVSDILGEVGITVVTATDGQEGLDRFWNIRIQSESFYWIWDYQWCTEQRY